MSKWACFGPVAAVALGACTYQATAPISPAFDVYSNYPDKLPGNYLLYVDSDAFKGVYKVQGFVCSAHSFPLDARGSFGVSVLKTFENLIEEVRMVDTPFDRSQLAQGGHEAQILVKAENLVVKLRVIPGFWSNTMEADVEMTASMSVDTVDGRVLGTTMAADEDEDADAGSACEGGAQAISGAASRAIKELVRGLGERLSNSPRLREL